MGRWDSYAARRAQDKAQAATCGDGAMPPEEEATPVRAPAAGADGGFHTPPPPVEHGGGLNGAEEEEDEGYSTPTSPSSRLRVPDVCPGAPTIRLEEEEEEEEGYGTPTSPSSRLRVPAVCPGAPRIPMEGPSTSMLETTERGVMRAPLRMWVCAILLCVYRHIRKST